MRTLRIAGARSRPFALLVGLAAITALQFTAFPGHTWLQADTQIYTPVLEHLYAPGLLSRDLVATHPNLTYTVYDEATLLLAKILRLDLRHALEMQQLVFRFAATTGVFLLARAAGVTDALSLLVGLLANLGVFVFGPDIAVVDTDPTPCAFAMGAVLLAAGFLATLRPLSASLAGGVALLYDVRIAASFWIVVILATAFDRRSRRLMRATLPVLAVFALLLANLAQLQPGVAETQSLWTRIPPAIAAIQRFRTPEIFVGSWSTWQSGWCLLLAGCCACGTARVWPRLGAPARWLFAGLPVAGAMSVPFSLALMEGAHWYLIPQFQPAVSLLLIAAFCAIACSIAAICVFVEGRRREAAVFVLIVALLPVSRLPDIVQSRTGNRTKNVASWALANTWGGSMFLFPDAGRARDPAVFRAESQRAVWVDWGTGKQADAFDSFADEWYRRWQDTMAGEYSEDRMRRFLSLPIDYYVLQRRHRLIKVRPVFADREFVVYDANDLRTAGGVFINAGFARVPRVHR
jgi:hypothetical protein